MLNCIRLFVGELLHKHNKQTIMALIKRRVMLMERAAAVILTPFQNVILRENRGKVGREKKTRIPPVHFAVIILSRTLWQKLDLSHWE